MARETSQEIDAAAAAWTARIDRGPLSVEDDERLEAWLAGDDRRRGAFMRMRAVALHSERSQALGPNFDPDTFAALELEPDPSPTRRYVLWGGASAIAASLVGAYGLGLIGGGVRFDTRRGEVRVVTLDDGSVVTLNTSSRLSVDFSKAQRLVRLEEGEALFDVAKDKSRPFIVEAGAAAMRAVGTSFTVKRVASNPVEILVREGVVEVSRPQAPVPVRMTANMRMVATAASRDVRPVAIAPEDVSREIAWKGGRIAFEGETLASAARAFERYSDIQIVIADPAVGREEISGLFATNDPVTFARAVASSLGLRAEVAPGEVRLSR
jgi:transmembrane sensor